MAGITIQRGLTSLYFHKQVYKRGYFKNASKYVLQLLSQPNDKWKNGILL